MTASSMAPGFISGAFLRRHFFSRNFMVQSSSKRHCKLPSSFRRGRHRPRTLRKFFVCSIPARIPIEAFFKAARCPGNGGYCNWLGTLIFLSKRTYIYKGYIAVNYNPINYIHIFKNSINMYKTLSAFFYSNSGYIFLFSVVFITIKYEEFYSKFLLKPQCLF